MLTFVTFMFKVFKHIFIITIQGRPTFIMYFIICFKRSFVKILDKDHESSKTFKT